MIIECKCKKYKFKIPKNENLVTGNKVKCEICNDEWNINLNITTSNNKVWTYLKISIQQKQILI